MFTFLFVAVKVVFLVFHPDILFVHFYTYNPSSLPCNPAAVVVFMRLQGRFLIHPCCQRVHVPRRLCFIPLCCSLEGRCHCFQHAIYPLRPSLQSRVLLCVYSLVFVTLIIAIVTVVVSLNACAFHSFSCLELYNLYNCEMK